MNKYIALFLVTILNLENYRYNYGRKASQVRKLPERDGKPDVEKFFSKIDLIPNGLFNPMSEEK